MGRQEMQDMLPDERIVRQWVRHTEKIRQQVRESAGRMGDEPALRIVLQARDVSRFLTVSDGDGFVAMGLRFRLLGMDAPEIGQTCEDAERGTWPCGERARWRLFELLSGRRLELLVHGVDCYGRLLCICLADGEDVAEVMVREGLAVCYRSEQYRAAQLQAIRQRRGMWRGSFEEPVSWRRANRHGGAQGEARSRLEGIERRVRKVSRKGPWDRKPAPVAESKVVWLHDKRQPPARHGQNRVLDKKCNDKVIALNSSGSGHGWQQLRKALRSLLERMRG